MAALTVRAPSAAKGDTFLGAIRAVTEFVERRVAQTAPRYSLPMMEGETAPNFALCDHTGQALTLSALLADGPVVLFFFPLASSPICTAQACHFRDLSNEFARVGARRVGISTNTVNRQAHFAQQRSFDYPLLSDADGVVSELFGVRRGTFAKLSRSVVERKTSRHGLHTRRRGLLARLLPVRRSTFVIDTDRTVVKVISNEVRASVHADQALRFLENHSAAHRSPQIQEMHAEALQHSEARPAEPETANQPSLVRPYMLTGGRIDSGIDLPPEAPVEAVNAMAKPPRWPRNDVRGQILTWCAHSTTVAEIAARMSLPLGATRFLVDDLVTQGYLRVRAPLGDSMSLDERRELITRTLVGLRAL